MRAADLLEESFAETEYGYWITPDAKIIVVGYQDHGKASAAAGFSSGNAAVERGWVRVIAYTGWFSCDFRADKLTPQKVRQMKKLAGVKQEEPFRNYELRWWWNEGEIMTDGFQTTQRTAFLAKLDDLDGGPIRESLIPMKILSTDLVVVSKPSVAQTIMMMRKFERVRGLEDAGVLYLWDGYQAAHFQVAATLGLENPIEFQITNYNDEPRLVVYDRGDALLAVPAMKRIVDKIQPLVMR